MMGRQDGVKNCIGYHREKYQKSVCWLGITECIRTDLYQIWYFIMQPWKFLILFG